MQGPIYIRPSGRTPTGEKQTELTTYDDDP